MSRQTLFCRVTSEETAVVMAAVIGLLGALPRGVLKSLTFDNGKEFATFNALLNRYLLAA